MWKKGLFVLSVAVLFVMGTSPAMGQDTLKLGGLFNLTGGMSSIDAPGLNGAKLKAKLLNEKGGVIGKKIEVIGYDTKTDQKDTATQARKALSDGVVAGLGYGDTTFVMAAAPAFQAKGVPFVTSGATHPELPKWVGNFMFMVPFGDDDQSYAIAEYTIFTEGAMIPKKHTCDAEDISPDLKWSGVPNGAQSLALICDDPDAPVGTWVHWVLFNIPADATALPAGIPAEAVLKNGARHGQNDFRKLGYGGPCPPGGTHRYYFKLFALDTLLTLESGSTKAQLSAAMKGHILAEGQLMGKYKR